MTSDNQFAHQGPGRPITNGGTKLDDGKVRLELIPGELVFAVGDILTFGAKKYAARNWEKGIHWGRVFGATMRHLWSWWQGKSPTTRNFLFGNVDGETGKSHLWHAATCLSFLIAYEERGMTAFDDRPEVHLPISYRTPQDYKRHSNPEGSHQLVGKYEDMRPTTTGATWHNETRRTIERHGEGYAGGGAKSPVNSEGWTGKNAGVPYAFRGEDRSDPEGGIPGRA